MHKNNQQEENTLRVVEKLSGGFIIEAELEMCFIRRILNTSQDDDL